MKWRLRWALWKLKAKLRDWLFKDYKWITRASVQQQICSVRWDYRNNPTVQRALNQLQETIK